MLWSVSLFREQAVRQYNDPDQRGGVLRSSPPSGVRVFVPLAILFVLAVVVASVQKVNVTARGRGVIQPAAGVVVVRAPQAGRISASDIVAGRVVEAGTLLFTVTAGLSQIDVSAPVAGTVDAWRVQPGTLVDAGAPMARIVPSDTALVAVLAIPAQHRSALSEGSVVRLRLDEYPAATAGFGSARVARVAGEPMMRGLDEPLLASAAQGPHYVVELTLESMPPQAQAAFRSGMTFTGEVVLREKRIIELLFAF